MLSVILSLMPAFAQTQRQDSIIVSLITCDPGPEVYELCGHEAVRIHGVTADGGPIDSVWNYGTFDFNQPNFIYRFVKGQTDYCLSSYPFDCFMPEYVAAGRRVISQDLNLTPGEARRLLGLLRAEARPGENTYRYNYVKDNCATRVVERLGQAADSQVIYSDSVAYGTFRNEMRAYHRDYPWYQFGIDICLGSGIDYPLRGREEMFVPLEMMKNVATARLADGRPLVRDTKVLFPGIPDATLGPTPFWLTPLACSWAFLVLSAVGCWIMWRRRRLWRCLYSIWFGLLGLTGCLVAFLIFVSSHEATSPNILFLWLNPLQLVIAAGIWVPRWRPAVVAMAVCDVIVLTVLLIVWPWQAQSANPAFFPLMGATWLLSAVYAIIARNNSYLSSVPPSGAKKPRGSGNRNKKRKRYK